MNILVIGNGFDLAHGLPTKYGDFLEFLKVIRQVIQIKNGDDISKLHWGDINLQVKKLIENNMGNVRNNLLSQKQIWNELLYDNIWIDYFLRCNMYQKENWIDFEREISYVIQDIDETMHDSTKGFYVDDKCESLYEVFLYQIYRGTKTFIDLRDRLLSDLNKLTRAFEMYLCEYVEKIEIKRRSLDIESLKEIDYILSFNYTDTYRNIYDVKNDIEYDYFHGKAKIENTVEMNNMVLGIDEYLSDAMRNENTVFIAFKKFYQRIYKGCKQLAVNWCTDIKKEYEYSTYSRKFMIEDQISFELVGKESDNLYKWEQYEELAFKYDKEYEKKHPKHNLYIFGHSLDVTDKDILRLLILNDNVKTTIFYPDKKELGKKIANLVKVIGQDELIRRTGGRTKTIEFKLQQDMVERV